MRRANFRAGHFETHRVHKAFKPFCPVSAYHSLESIPLEGLHNRGKKLILLDVDNTLVLWKGEDFTPEVLAWIEEAKGLGFHLCILSNTRHPERLKRLSTILGIKAMRDRFKPSTKMYLMALKEFDVTADEAVMVGDQILTDILGANRSGIEGIWVHRIHEREFIGTRFNRQIEKLILRVLYRAMPLAEALTERTPAGSLGRQFIKFAVVGGSSTVIDFGLFFLLKNYVPWQGGLLSQALGEWLQSNIQPLFRYAHTPQEAAAVVIQAFATAVAIFNSFYWNRRWTFGITDSHDKGKQFTRFLILSVSGLILTVALVAGISHILPFAENRNYWVAKIIAMVVVAFWNFGGQRLWAFKKH